MKLEMNVGTWCMDRSIVAGSFPSGTMLLESDSNIFAFGRRLCSALLDFGLIWLLGFNSLLFFFFFFFWLGHDLGYGLGPNLAGLNEAWPGRVQAPKKNPFSKRVGSRYGKTQPELNLLPLLGSGVFSSDLLKSFLPKMEKKLKGENGAT